MICDAEVYIYMFYIHIYTHIHTYIYTYTYTHTYIHTYSIYLKKIEIGPKHKMFG